MPESKYAVGVDIGEDAATVVLARTTDDHHVEIVGIERLDPEKVRAALRRMTGGMRELGEACRRIARDATESARRFDELGRALRPKRTGLAAQRSPYGPQR